MSKNERHVIHREYTVQQRAGMAMLDHAAEYLRINYGPDSSAQFLGKLPPEFAQGAMDAAYMLRELADLIALGKNTIVREG